MAGLLCRSYCASLRQSLLKMEQCLLEFSRASCWAPIPGSPAAIPLFLRRSPTVWTGYEDSAHLDEVNGAHIWSWGQLMSSNVQETCSLTWTQTQLPRESKFLDQETNHRENSSHAGSTAGGQTGKARAVPTAGSDKHHGSPQHGIQRCLRGKSTNSVRPL